LSGAREIASGRPPRGAAISGSRFDRVWVNRAVFGFMLAAVAAAATIAGSFPFAILVGAVCVAALREWHRIVEQGGFARELLLDSIFLVSALMLMSWRPGSFVPWAVLAVAAGLVFVGAFARGARPFWHASGVLYIGVPALLLTYLRASVPHAPWVIMGLFLVVWATDTGALMCGKLIGGPKLFATLSPNKTWAGAVGGVALACIVMGAYIASIRGSVLAAMSLALVLSVCAHAGDLLESWVKRRFHLKDSGGLIPGHGGVLDRIDSMLAASAAMAALVVIGGVDATFGARV